MVVAKKKKMKLWLKIVRLMSDHLTDAQTSEFETLVAPWQKHIAAALEQVTLWNNRYVRFDHGDGILESFGTET